MAVDRFEAELKPEYEDKRKFWNDYFTARDEYYNEE